MQKPIYILLFLHFFVNTVFSQCNGAIELCERKYNNIAYLTTHNSFNSSQDGLLFPNQTYNIATQLEDGVRALMIDVYDFFGTPTAFHSIFALGTIPLSDIFNDIKNFLDDNPNEIITIILECYVEANDIENVISQSGLSNYLYTHDTNLDWPKIQEMISNNSRLIIFSDKNDANSSQLWYHYLWDFAVETNYSVDNINDFSCDFNRGDPLNDLFILNHFITDSNLGYGLYNESNAVNSNPFFINRTLECHINKFPNFVTLDYYELGNGIDVVNYLNSIETSDINLTESNSKIKPIRIYDILGRETEIKSNSILFYAYKNGLIEKKIIIK